MASRNSKFTPEHEPLRNHPDLQLNNDKIHGPFSFLNPTRAHYNTVPRKKAVAGADSDASEQGEPNTAADGADDVPASNIEYKWTSRNNRKGRHALVITRTDPANATFAVPPPTNRVKHVLQTIGKMFWYYPLWDVSYDVAFVFTLGSIVWVINAFFSFLPYTNPSTFFPGETLYGGGITAFIGATIFEIGSVLLMFEAVNENRSGCFGWALEEVYEETFGHDTERGGVTRLTPSGCTHHHPNKKNLVGKAHHNSLVTTDEKNPSVGTDGTPPGEHSWVWYPSWHELRTHYLRDLGFLACSSQMFGATVFWISGFTALPGIYNHLTPLRELNGWYWVPQIIGGSGFVVSGTLFMIETQKHWYQPAFNSLGWHIGLWNLIGGVGFTLCPIFGLGMSHWREYQAACSTFWGSWAFLVGSVIQLYESLDKNPVESAPKVKGEGDQKSSV